MQAHRGGVTMSEFITFELTEPGHYRICKDGKWTDHKTGSLGFPKIAQAWVNLDFIHDCQAEQDRVMAIMEECL